MSNLSSETWRGPTKIVLGIDIGTTLSAVSYYHLYPGGKMTITPVSKWPGQPAQKSESKIPTLVWYDSENNAVSYGASALNVNPLDAQDKGWRLAKHFKLHLHPETMRSTHQLEIDELPSGVPLSQIYSDFMSHLLQHTRQFFEERVIAGDSVWRDYFDSSDIIIAHPNGWGLNEQDFLRKAAIRAGFPDPEQTTARIRFVTEAEASVHFCLFHANLGEWLMPDVEFIVCDAGGSTVDITTYKVLETHPRLQLIEQKASACIQAGSIFIDAAAEQYIRNLFLEAHFEAEDIEEYVQRGMKNFEDAKKAFPNADDTDGDVKVEVGRNRFSYDENGVLIRRGELILQEPIMRSFFEPCVAQIIDAIDVQMTGLNAKHILLVGGFGESPYLRQELSRTFGDTGCQVTIANDFTSKAVADGAVIWNTEPTVTGRACRFSFGAEISEKLNPTNPEHKDRATFVGPDGARRVMGKWSQVAAQGQVFKPEEDVSQNFRHYFKTSNPPLGNFKVSIFAFTTPGTDTPNYLRAPNNKSIVSGFEKVCELSADLGGMSGALVERDGADGKFWSLPFTIGVQFGGVELQAYLEWTENGKKRRDGIAVLPSVEI